MEKREASAAFPAFHLVEVATIETWTDCTVSCCKEETEPIHHSGKSRFTTIDQGRVIIKPGTDGKGP